MFITVNGAFGGSVKVARALLSGYNPADIPFLRHWDIPQPVSDIDVRDLSQTLASLFSLTPHEDVYSSSYPVVTMQDSTRQHVIETYSMGNWSSMIPESDTKNHIMRARQAIRDIAIKDPGIPTLCVWSVFDLPSTEAHYVYHNYDFNSTPSISLTQGDGTLPLQSLRVCSDWPSTVAIREFPNLDHMYALRAPEVIEFVIKALQVLS